MEDFRKVYDGVSNHMKNESKCKSDTLDTTIDKKGEFASLKTPSTNLTNSSFIRENNGVFVETSFGLQVIKQFRI